MLFCFVVYGIGLNVNIIWDTWNQSRDILENIFLLVMTGQSLIICFNNHWSYSSRIIDHRI